MLHIKAHSKPYQTPLSFDHPSTMPRPCFDLTTILIQENQDYNRENPVIGGANLGKNLILAKITQPTKN
jgi:hypothetical protein